jgi:hypothetical protein
VRGFAVVVTSCAFAVSSCAGSIGERSDEQPAADSTTTGVTVTDLPAARSTDVTAPAPPGTTIEQAQSIPIGTWDWSPPCRVPVTETVSSSTDGPSVRRTYVVDVSADPEGDGYVVAFDDVVIDSDLSDAEAATVLVQAGAFLPTMRLDFRGGFVEFVDLDEVVTASVDATGATTSGLAVDTYVASPEAEEAIRSNTVDSWYGYWSDRGHVVERSFQVPSEPGVSHIGFTPYETEVLVSGREIPPGRPGVPGTPPSGSIEVVRYEEAKDTLLEAFRSADLPGFEQVARVWETSSATTTLDPTNLRPSQVNRSSSMWFYGPDEGSHSRVVDNLVLSTFDWGTAEGCLGR